MDKTSSDQNEKVLKQLAYDLVMSEEGPNQLAEFSSHMAVLRSEDNLQCAVLVAYHEQMGNSIYGLLRHIFSNSRSSELELVVVGGPASIQTLIKKARPRLTRVKIRAYHLDDDAGLWTATPHPFEPPPLFAALKEFDGNRDLSQDQWDAFEKKSKEQLDSWKIESQRVGDFAHSMQAKQPIATRVLLAIFAVLFLAEISFGGSESTPTLVRMGAMVPERVWSGEWYRLISCAFLHHGLMHILFNSYVIYALGSSLERLIGTPRFIMTYGLSAIGGSLASLFFMDGSLSVGASGALWGLLGAEAVLGYFPRGIIPPSVVESVKKTALINLAINLLYSFQPHIDIAAHFGGGLVGAALVFSGIATIGLPRFDQATAGQNNAQDHQSRQPPAFVRSLNIILMLIFSVGLSMALINGKPWALSLQPTLERRELGNTQFSVLLPAILHESQPMVSKEGWYEFTFGESLSEPAVVAIAVSSHAPSSLKEREEGAEIFRKKIATDQSKQLTLMAHPKVKNVASSVVVTASFRISNNLILLRRLVMNETTSTKIDVLLWPQFQSTYGDLINDIADSLKYAGTPTSEQ